MFRLELNLNFVWYSLSIFFLLFNCKYDFIVVICCIVFLPSHDKVVVDLLSSYFFLKSLQLLLHIQFIISNQNSYMAILLPAIFIEVSLIIN